MPPLDSSAPTQIFSDDPFARANAVIGRTPRRDAKRMMPADELKVIIAKEMSTAVGAEDGKLAQDRQELMSYYQGEEFANPPPGQNRSRVVMLTVLETVEWVLPALLRIFTASDQIAELAPVRTSMTPPPTAPGMPPPMDPEEAARQATVYTNHVFNVDNDGFLILHDWFKDGLLQKVGWIKRWWSEEKVRETNSFTGLTEEEYAAKLRDLGDPNSSAEVEIIEETSYPAPTPSGMGEDAPQPIPDIPGQQRPKLYDCKIRVTRKQGRIMVRNVPPEEILFSRRSTRDDIPFLCHRSPVTQSQLLQEGYDRECLEEIGWADSDDYNSERLQRYAPDDDMPFAGDRTDKPMRTLWREENYVMADYDGDGVAELLKVTTVNKAATILRKNGKPDIEEVDEIPFDYLCPVPMPHKLVGMSVADLVMDLQRIKSTLIRQMLDNIYLTNNPRHLVVEGAATDETYDDLLTSKPGGIVRSRQADGVVPLVTPFVAEKAQGLVEYMDQTAEVRTGISRHNQGLDPDDLNKTATGVNLIQQAAAQRVELIARIFAFSVQKMVRGILGLIKKHAQQERIIRVSGAPLQTDPAQWKNDMTVSVSVGLGTGNRDQIMSHLMALLNVQQQIVMAQGGIDGPLVFGKNIYDTVTKLSENAGFKSNWAVQDPTVPPPPSVTGPPKPPKPDPQAAQAMALAQAEIEINKQKAQTDAQLNEQKAGHQANLANQKASQEMQLNQQTAEHQQTLDRQKLAHDFAMAQLKANNDMEIEKLRAANDMEIERMKAENAATVAMHKVNMTSQPQAGE